jgi:hypothetical protein
VSPQQPACAPRSPEQPFLPGRSPSQWPLYPPNLRHGPQTRSPRAADTRPRNPPAQALHRDPLQRASTADLLRHPWLSKVYDEEELSALAALCRSRGSALGMGGFGGGDFNIGQWEY